MHLSAFKYLNHELCLWESITCTRCEKNVTAHLPVGDDATPSSMRTSSQSFDTGSIAHTVGTAPTPLPCSIPPTESSPQGDTSMLAPCGFIGPTEESGTSGPSASRVQPLWVVADMLLLLQRSSKAPDFPVPPETNRDPSTTVAVWLTRAGGRVCSSLVVFVHLRKSNYALHKKRFVPAPK